MDTPKQLAKKWIKALRSGKYPKAQSALVVDEENGRGYCCLGVLCEVSKKQFGLEITKFKSDLAYSSSGRKYDKFPPPVVKNFLRLGNKQEHLAEMNDSENKDFTEIADYIEKEILPTL